MSFTYGFYNSVNGDRKYNSLQISKIFDGIITDGVYQSIGTRFIIKAYTGGVSNKVEVGIGRAWFDHTWCLNDTSYPLDMPWPDVLLNRYDAIMMDIDSTSTRVNSIIVVEGTLTSSVTPVKPVPIRTANHNQYVLAYVLRPANSYPDIADILASEIENTVGTSLCPFVTGILQGMNIDDLILQWKGQFSEFLLKETDLFNIWFNTVKGQLSTDPAGHLQLQVNELVDSIAGKEISTFGNFVGDNKWSGFVMGSNGKSYGIPNNSASVVELDTSVSEPNVNYISTFGNVVGVDKWRGGVLAPNGKIYCAPYNATNIGVIDPIAKTLTTIGTVAAGSAKYAGGVLAPNGTIYFIPLAATSILVFDPVAGTTSTFGALGTGDKWYGGVLASNGKIYCIPYASLTVLIIDTLNKTTTTIPCSIGTNKWAGGVLATNGHIIGIPWEASTILDIDPVTNSVGYFGEGSMNPHEFKYSGGVLAPNGKIYCAPMVARKVLEIDPVTKIVAEIGQNLESTTIKWMGVIYSKNCIYGCPSNSTTILKIKDVDTINARVKTVEAKIGNMPELDTKDQTALVKAANEILLTARSGWSSLRNGDFFVPTTQNVTAPNFQVKTTDILNSFIVLDDYLSVGMKIRLKQGGAFKYFFIVKIEGNIITLYGGTDYALTTAGMSDVGFSVVQSPHGFPIASTGLGVDFVIERGSNVNGSYTKFASGKMTCEGSSAILIPANTQYVVATIIIPKPFIDANYMWTGSQGGQHGIPQLGLATFGQAGVKNYSGFTTHVKTDGIYPGDQYIVLHYIAEGKWK